jgi:hypothetical protein
MEFAGLLVLTQRAQIGGEIVGGVQRGGMVIAQHPAVAAQGVLIEFACLLRLTARAQTGGEIVGQAQGDYMVITQHATVVGQSVLIDCCLHRSDRRDRLTDLRDERAYIR